jgi:replicative DNA helicase
MRRFPSWSSAARWPGPVTLKNYLEKDGDLEHVGGTEYLAEFASSVITIINAEDDGRTIYDLYLRRELIALGQDLLRDAYEPRLEQEHGTMAIIEQTEGRLFRLAEAGNMGGGVQTLYEALRKAAESAQLVFNHDGGVTGVTTGLRSLDRRLGGLQPSDLIILAGRAWARPRLPPILASMPRGAMRRRKEGKGPRSGSSRWKCQASSWAGVCWPNKAGFRPMLCAKGRSIWGISTASPRSRRSMPPCRSISNRPPICRSTRSAPGPRRMKRQYGIGLLIIDYLQLLRRTDSLQARQNRTVEVSEITRGLKCIAKDLNMPVLALSQLSRDVEKREDKRPQLADLRDSGAIEQDADIACLMHE